ncbi:uncharacterized protein LOC111429900 [Cucurbita moschata]|uniref:Uncharacterized protein LOC111429900 n=1 Tax=Cucurbita moschata TaxID=3662 RepID=A0A6J1E284_CUCMO|nr:uncharacterized protein LOC111429900 [Cucurbita moschata]
MRKGPFLLLLISLLCLCLLPFCLSEAHFTNKAYDPYKHLKQGRPRKDLQDSKQINVGAATKVMRARGVYGGGNDIHRGHSKNDANPLRIKSTSSLLWDVSCGFFSLCVLLTGL